LEDVAARAGVSRALVSIVVRGAAGASAESRTRILTIAAEMGYRPDKRASLLAGHRSQLIGVTLVISHPFHADLVEGIYASAERHGYEVVLSAVTPSRGVQRAVETLLDYRCEAAILLAPVVSESWLSTVGARLPTVIVGYQSKNPAVDVIRAADRDGMRLAVDHLVGLGHRSIVHIDGGRGSSASDRRQGYRQAMRAHGLVDQSRVISGGPSEEAGAKAAGRLFDGSELPTAAVTYNDRCAVGLCDVLIRSAISVPRDLSVIGYDDSQIARLPHIGLTTVSQDASRMANLAVERAVARLTGSEVTEREIVLAPHLVIRGTSAFPRTGSLLRTQSSKVRGSAF
jgi:DNA-binding LacI/PurR family transcriptional regulator